jgi:hypothetical protein
MTFVQYQKRKTQKEVRKNREILSSVVKCVVLCGKQNLPLRGHRDDSQHIDDNNINSGNFQALINFRVNSLCMYTTD